MRSNDDVITFEAKCKVCGKVFQMYMDADMESVKYPVCDGCDGGDERIPNRKHLRGEDVSKY